MKIRGSAAQGDSTVAVAVSAVTVAVEIERRDETENNKEQSRLLSLLRLRVTTTAIDPWEMMMDKVVESLGSPPPSRRTWKNTRISAFRQPCALSTFCTNYLCLSPAVGDFDFMCGNICCSPRVAVPVPYPRQGTLIRVTSPAW